MFSTSRLLCLKISVLCDMLIQEVFLNILNIYVSMILCPHVDAIMKGLGSSLEEVV